LSFIYLEEFFNGHVKDGGETPDNII